MWAVLSLLAPKRPAYRARGRGFRPRVEALEDRYCLSPGVMEWTDPTGGLLDPTFGSGGTALSGTGTTYQSLTDVTVLSGGKLLAAGYMNTTSSGGSIDFVAARYNADGTPDTSFGSGGLATVDFKGGADRAMAAAVQPGTGGKILLAGTAQLTTGDVFGVVRLNPNGALDTTFGGKGSGGKVTVGRSRTEAGSMAVLPDGRFILAGLVKNSSNAGSLVLTRFNADGSLDTTFGNKGTVVTSVAVRDMANLDQHSVRVAVDASGRTIVTATTASAPGDFLVARFNPNGSLDTSFGAARTGVVTTDVLPGSTDNARALALQADGKIVGGGGALPVNGAGYLLALARYNPDGTLDPTFDGDGIVTTDAVMNYPSGAEVYALAVQADGRIVAAGQASQASNLVVVMRFNADGSTDAANYGPSATGAVLTPYGENSRVSGAALQPDGRLVVVGSMNTTSPYAEYFALTRFLATAPSPSPVQIGSFTAAPSPVAAGSPVTLTAGGITTADAGATVTEVAFYIVDPAGVALLLGYGAQNSDGTWTLTLTVNPAHGPGQYLLLALAVDSSGVISDPVGIYLDVT
jgi:uncharacterized delta-60 repeat protein